MRKGVTIMCAQTNSRLKYSYLWVEGFCMFAFVVVLCVRDFLTVAKTILQFLLNSKNNFHESIFSST